MKPVKSPFRDFIASLGLKANMLAAAGGVSEAAISFILNKNRWPSTPALRDDLREKIRNLLISSGGDAAQIEKFLSPQPKITETATMDEFVCQHFGFDHNPFAANRIKEKNILQTEEHKRLIRRLESAAEESDFIFLIGNNGSGKSTAIQMLWPRLETRKIRLCKFMASDIPKTESVMGHLVTAMHRAIGLPEKRVSQQTRLEDIHKYLASSGAGLLVLIDDAHTLHPFTLLALKRRWDALTVGMRHLVGFVLIGQPLLWQTLSLDSLAEVKGHSDRYEIMGLLGEGEVAAYIDAKMAPFKITNNCGTDRWFRDDVASHIFSYLIDRKIPRDKFLRYRNPQIFPRELNELLIECFEIAYRAEDKQINADHVDLAFANKYGVRH